MKFVRMIRIVAILCFLLVYNILQGQEHPRLRELLNIPYIGDIKGASNSDRLIFTVNEKGRRNIYIADGPDYIVRKVTNFEEDDAQEITSLSISPDGKWAVFARGGDHGANSSAVAVNSASFIEPTKIEIYTLSLTDNKLFNVGVGDFPIFHPSNQSITYLRGGNIWTAPVGRDNSGKQLVHMRGSAGNMQWSPDGKQLAFASRRGAYSFVGIYTNSETRLRWVSPSYHTDAFPQWSPDGKKIAFIRRNAKGGALDSITSVKYQPWAILVADLQSDKVSELYAAPVKQEASYPRIAGGVNLRWNNQSYITFMSYEDGWPHLYRVDTRSKAVKQLTKGNFTVEGVGYDNLGDNIIFAANTGKDKLDFDRTHIGRVNISTGKLEMLTEGEGIESTPFYFNNDHQICFRSSTYESPVQPTVYTVATSKTKNIASDFYKILVTDFVKPEQIFITSDDGVRFSAQYYKPRNVKKDLPALVYIHGGPRRQMYLGWHHRGYYFHDYIVNQYLVQQGYAVLSVNYRMGTGYGYDFQHPKGGGAFGVSEYLDILAAGKWLQSQTDIDINKIGVFGGSYGGYLTAMALGKNSDIFKVGVDIHGVHSRVRKQNPDFYAPDFELASKLNWESSPSRWVDGWKSPVLLIHGDDDQNVAFSQSIDIYNRLKEKDVEVEVLVLPDENHHWQLFENLIKVKEATVNFINRKLK